MSEPAPRLLDAPERVLPSLNPDGTRRWIRPRTAFGAFRRRRRAVAWALMAVFLIVPYLTMNGRPLVLLDLPRREFTLFGTTFLPTETVLVQLLALALAIGILFFTAVLGRAWCGWACPQTVYMEFLFRPLEYALEGGPSGVRKLDQAGGLAPRRLLKYAVFGILALVLAHTFLGYFVGVEELARWVRRSPVEHPTSFLIMLGTTALVCFDFAYFREQTCLVACPYGRLQSVLLDRRSWIVGYDARRGEPRGRGTKARPASAGDCIDCGLCVLTCPTGIDIRDGLQMECIHCTQCMDSCDAVMTKIGRPPGLIRYGSRDGFEGRRHGRLRPRILLYPAALALTLGSFAWQLGTRGDAEVTLLRGLGAPYTIAEDGAVVNQVRIRVSNRGREPRAYAIVIEGAPEAKMVAPQNPLPVPAGEIRTTSLFVLLPPAAFDDGRRPVIVRIHDGGRFRAERDYLLVGPGHEVESDDETEAHR